MQGTDTTVETIDITPKWLGILDSLLLIVIESEKPGTKITGDDRAYALNELRRMARLADLYVAGYPKEGGHYMTVDRVHDDGTVDLSDPMRQDDDRPSGS